MKKRVFVRDDGCVLVTTFAEKAVLKNEIESDAMDRITARLPHRECPYFDILPEDVPTKTLPDGTCGRCRWRAQNGAIIIDASAPCVCGKDEERAIREKIKSPIQAVALDGLLELERMKIRNAEKRPHP